MKKTWFCVLGAALLSAAAFAAETTVAKVYDGQLSMIEGEIVPLVDAMPADKFSFAPANGEFKGVRTFAEQAKHVAAVIYIAAAAAKQEKPPVDLGQGENGPDSVKTKADILKFLKDSFAYAHKVMLSLDAKNQMELVKSPFGGPDVARAGIASATVWHTFDHYGQMVVYARMNGIIPPASRPAPPTPAAKKK